MSFLLLKQTITEYNRVEAKRIEYSEIKLILIKEAKIIHKQII